MSDENSNLRPWIDPALEVRIVALVLGEASDFEREELERLIAEDADLANFKKRIESTHGLLEEFAADGQGSSAAEMQLPEAMRSELLAIFSGEASSAADQFDSAEIYADEDVLPFPWRKALAIAAAVALMALIGSMMMPVFHIGLSEADNALSRRPPMIAKPNGGADAAVYFDTSTTELASSATSTSPAPIALAVADSQDRARQALEAMNDYGFVPSQSAPMPADVSSMTGGTDRSAQVGHGGRAADLFADITVVGGGEARPQAGRDLRMPEDLVRADASDFDDGMGVAAVGKPDEGNANSLFKREFRGGANDLAPFRLNEIEPKAMPGNAAPTREAEVPQLAAESSARSLDRLEMPVAREGEAPAEESKSLNRSNLEELEKQSGRDLMVAENARRKVPARPEPAPTTGLGFAEVDSMGIDGRPGGGAIEDNISLSLGGSVLGEKTVEAGKSVSGSGSRQASDGNMPAGEQLAAGGIDSTRGFDTIETTASAKPSAVAAVPAQKQQLAQVEELGQQLNGPTMFGAVADSPVEPAPTNRGRITPSINGAAPAPGLAGEGGAVGGGGGGAATTELADRAARIQTAVASPAKTAESLNDAKGRTAVGRELAEGIQVGHGQVTPIDVALGDEEGRNKSLQKKARASRVTATGTTSGGTVNVTGVADAQMSIDGGSVATREAMPARGGSVADPFAAVVPEPSEPAVLNEALASDKQAQRVPATPPPAAPESTRQLGRVVIDEGLKTEDRLTRGKVLAEVSGKLEAAKELAMPGLAIAEQPEIVEFNGFVQYGTTIKNADRNGVEVMPNFGNVESDAEMGVPERDGDKRVAGQAVDHFAWMSQNEAQLENKVAELKDLADNVEAMPADPFSPAPQLNEPLYEDGFGRTDQVFDTDADANLEKQIHITSKFVEHERSTDGELGFDWLLNQPGTGAGMEPGVAKGIAMEEDYRRTASDQTRARFDQQVERNWETPGASPITSGMRSGGEAVTGDSIDGRLAVVVPDVTMGPATAPDDPFAQQDQYFWRDSKKDSGTFSATPSTTTSFESRVVDSKAPSVLARSGEREKIEVVRDFVYPTEYGEPEIPAAYKVRAEAKAKAKTKAPSNLGEIATADEAFSTFSLHVSDVSFKLAQASLESGEWPDAERIRIEEFVNAFDYGDPLPSLDEKVACEMEQTIHPFLQQRNLLRISMRTAAAGRSGSTPLNLTLVLDNSGSMERHDRRETVGRAFDLLTRQLQPNDQATLIGFARTPRLLAEQVSGEHRQQLLQVLADTPSEGGTNLEQALRLAIEKASAQKVDGAQNRVILLTDGAANLGDADPDSLASTVHAMRTAGIAFDAAGIGADGLNDEILEALTRKGDGRYYLLDRPEDADAGFARQIAGALRPAAMNVKVQIEFNPDRVSSYKLLGFEKHRLNKEDFRDDSVDAAEIAAEEAGVAVYQFEPMADGSGDVGTAFLRFRDMSSGEMVEKRWAIPYAPDAPRPDQAAPEVRIATAAALFAARLKGDVLGESVSLSELTQILNSLPEQFSSLERVQQLQRMIEQARNLEAR